MEPSAEGVMEYTGALVVGAQLSSSPVVMSYAMRLARDCSFSPAAEPAGRAVEKLPAT